jgi:hypothetical protein
MREAASGGPFIDLAELERRLIGKRPAEASVSDPFEELERMLYGNGSPPSAEPADREGDAGDCGPNPPGFPPACSNEHHYEDERPAQGTADQNDGWPQHEQPDYFDFSEPDEEPGRPAREDGEGESRPRAFRPWRVAAGAAALAIVSAGLTLADYRGGAVKSIKQAASVEPAEAKREKSPPPAREVARNEQPPTPAPVEEAPRFDGVSAPTPRKVRSVQVRPDGRILDQEPARESGSEQVVAAAPEPRLSIGAFEPSEPSTGAPAGPVAADDDPPAREESPAPGEGAKIVSALEPEADAPKRFGGRNSFEVRFGSAETQEEARKLMQQVVARFGSQLGAQSLGYRREKVDGKSAYVVRLRRHLGRDAAAGICERVTASGGECSMSEK